jgi:hypothetical protein
MGKKAKKKARNLAKKKLTGRQLQKASGAYKKGPKLKNGRQVFEHQVEVAAAEEVSKDVDLLLVDGRSQVYVAFSRSGLPSSQDLLKGTMSRDAIEDIATEGDFCGVPYVRLNLGGGRRTGNAGLRLERFAADRRTQSRGAGLKHLLYSFAETEGENREAMRRFLTKTVYGGRTDLDLVLFSKDSRELLVVGSGSDPLVRLRGVNLVDQNESVYVGPVGKALSVWRYNVGDTSISSIGGYRGLAKRLEHRAKMIAHGDFGSLARIVPEDDLIHRDHPLSEMIVDQRYEGIQLDAKTGLSVIEEPRYTEPERVEIVRPRRREPRSTTFEGIRPFGGHTGIRWDFF